MSFATLIKVVDPYHPLNGQSVTHLECAGPLSALAPSTNQPFIILRNGEAVLRSDWQQVVEKDDIIIVVMLPRGGGKGGSNPLVAVLQIVLMVYAPYIGAAINGSLFAAESAMAFVLSNQMLGSIVGMATMALVNAMLPKAKAATAGASTASMQEASPTYNLSAQGNVARLEQAIPEHFGRMLAFPDFAAAPYQEYISNEQYVYMLLCIGRGAYDLEKIKIADSDISSFDEVTYQLVGPNEQLTLFPSAVSTADEVAGQEAEFNTVLGPYHANNAGTITTRIGIDVTCPGGLFYAEDDGDLATRSVTFHVEAQQVDDLDQPTGSWFSLGIETISAKTNTAQQRSYTYTVPEGRYQVRLTRTSADDTSTRVADTLVWAGLRSYLIAPNTFGDVTLLAVRFKATNNLSSQASRKISVIATRKLPVWSGTTWSALTPTRSIAWAIAYACKAAGLPDSRIDLAGLLALDAIWTARGDTFDGRFDSTTTFWDAVSQIAYAGRSKVFMQGGIMYCWRDQPQYLPVAKFSMRNIVRGSFSMDFTTPTDDTADSVQVTYFDETVWAWRRVTCTLPGSTAERPAKIKLFGVVRRKQAYEMGLYLAACNKYRRTFATFQTEMEGFIPSYGNLASLSHDLPQWGQSLEAEHWNAGTRVLTLNEPPVWTEGADHYVGLRRRNGSESGPYLVTEGSSPCEVVLSQDPEVLDPSFEWYLGSEAERTHVTFGRGSNWRKRVLVMAARPKDMNHVELTVVVENDLVHTADGTSTVPAMPEEEILPTVPAKPVLSAIYVSQSGEPNSPIVVVAWPAASGAEFYRVEWSSNALTWNLAGESAGHDLSFSAPPGPLHVRARAHGTAPGPWVVWSGVAGEVPVPGRPQGLALVEPWLSATARWKWSAGARASSYEVELYANSVLKRTFETTALTYDYASDQIVADGGPWRSVEIRVRSKGPTGVSDWVSLVSVNPQVGVLSGVAFVPGYQQVIGTYSLPADTDFSGVRVAMSQTSGFDQTLPENLAYDGYDQIFVLTQGPGGVAFATDQVWYLRIAGYDKFGTDSLTWSAEHSVTIAGIDATMTPEEVLEKLNSSFVQGNVVLAGAGAITVYNGAPSVPNRDFVALTAGTISFQRYRDGQYREYKSLKRVEAGSAPSGQTVTLPGYWDTQPKVTVSPQSLMSYRASYSAQNQTWACRADNLREDPADSGIWKFDAVAELQLSSAAGTTSINQATGDTASNSWDSSIYTLPANTHDITVNVQVKSKRGTGAHTAEWAYRSVLVQVYAYASSAGWYVAGSKTIAPGTVLDSFIAGSIVCSSLVSGTTQFYVRYTASDAGGTWYASGDVYNYGSDSLTGTGQSQAKTYSTDVGTDNYGNTGYAPASGVPYTLPYTPPSGWTVYQTDYHYSVSGWAGYSGGPATVWGPNGVAHTASGSQNAYVFVNGVWGYGSALYTVAGTNWAMESWSRVGTYDANACKVTANAAGVGGNIYVKDVTATVYRRQLITNSASPVNAFTLSNYSWQLSSASALATGSINYLAVGD